MKKQILRGVQILKRGGIIAYPTDTVYGIGTSAFNTEAVQRIYHIKQRPLSFPLSVAVTGKFMAQRVAYLNEQALRLIAKYWPGALTIIVKKKSVIPSVVTGGSDLVGLRAPAHVVPLSILRYSKIPMISTSANKHGKPPCLDGECIRYNFGDQVDMIIEGEQGGEIPSTVINVTIDPPVIVRQGPITKSMIEQILN
jgi:L-threonylcarbamoyladenylate synthase